MVGRLDVNTSGLLIFSNNGDLVQKLSHPGSMIERNYLCRIFGNPTKSQINNLLNGVEVDGKRSSFDQLISINKKSNAKYWYKQPHRKKEKSENLGVTITSVRIDKVLDQ